jgi:hypothetical protein
MASRFFIGSSASERQVTLPIADGECTWKRQCALTADDREPVAEIRPCAMVQCRRHALSSHANSHSNIFRISIPSMKNMQDLFQTMPGRGWAREQGVAVVLVARSAEEIEADAETIHARCFDAEPIRLEVSHTFSGAALDLRLS